MALPQIQVVLFLLLSIISMPSPANSQPGPPLPGRFRHAREIVPGGAGPNRLVIDAALLAGTNSRWQFSYKSASAESRQKQSIAARGGLSDLRIYDASNREVPYLLIEPSVNSPSIPWVAGGLRPAPLRTSIAFERRESEPGVSRYRLRLPGLCMPITDIKLSAAGSNILRQARITEGRISGSEIAPYELGAAVLRREVRGELSAAELSIPIMPPKEALLDLVIEDGDNPPMEITGISVLFATLPWIYFESPDAGPLTARYGYEDLKEPAYDLEAARSSVSKARTAEARWGVDRKNMAEAERPAAEAMPDVGSKIDLGNFRFVRNIAESEAGLTILPLDAAVLAHSNLEDLRIALPDGHQIAYLLEKAAEPLSLPLNALEKISEPRPFPKKDGAGSVSCYRLRLPYPNLPPARLVFTTSARVFHRTLRLAAEYNPYNERGEPWAHAIAEEAWNHADPETAAPALTLTIPSLRSAEALVVVEEGDNSPLPIASVRLLLPAYRMRFLRGRETNLKLYYGHSDLQAPRYDLEILASRLVGAAAEEIAMDPENAKAPIKTQLLPLKFFWGILIAAVLALLAIVVRLIKQTKEESRN